jgi:hypothetical protein
MSEEQLIETGVQDRIKTIGTDGCYALCLCKIAETALGLRRTAGQTVDLILDGVCAGFFSSDMTVRDGEGFLQYATNVKWSLERTESPPAANPLLFVIAEWFNKRTGFTHFTLREPILFDPLQNSVTVKEGYIRSYRVYRRA